MMQIKVFRVVKNPKEEIVLNVPKKISYLKHNSNLNHGYQNTYVKKDFGDV